MPYDMSDDVIAGSGATAELKEFQVPYLVAFEYHPLGSRE